MPVVITFAIYTWSWYAYTFQLVLYSMQSSVQQLLCLIVFQILYVLSLWSYLRTIFTPRVRIPSKFYLSLEMFEELTKANSDQHKDEILAYVVKKNGLPVCCRTYNGGIRYCEKCNLIKPDRCHHCSICRTCVLKMDHHCPWINNCVSFMNYKFFVLFLGYIVALCIFAACTIFPYFLKFWLPPEQPEQISTGDNTTSIATGPQTGMSLVDGTTNIDSQQDSQIPYGVKFHILFLFFVSAMLSIGVSFLYGYHVYLLLHNRTTLEAFRPPLMAYGPDRNAFNLGKRENVQQLFGRAKLLWLLPLFTSEGSGLTYDLRPHLSHDEEVRQELLVHSTNNQHPNGHYSANDATGSEL